MPVKRSRSNGYGTYSPKKGRSVGKYSRRPKAPVPAMLGIEKKFLDMEYDAVITATLAGSEADPATLLGLTSIAQGDGESNRDGR